MSYEEVTLYSYSRNAGSKETGHSNLGYDAVVILY